MILNVKHIFSEYIYRLQQKTNLKQKVHKVGSATDYCCTGHWPVRLEIKIFSYMNTIAQKYMKRCPREMEQVQCTSFPKNICTQMNAIWRGSNLKQECICTFNRFYWLIRFLNVTPPSPAFDVISLHLETPFLDIYLSSCMHDLLKMSLFNNILSTIKKITRFPLLTTQFVSA